MEGLGVLLNRGTTMACPKCGCKVSYQYDNGDDCGPTDDRLERCAACGEVFDLDDHTNEEDNDE
jgi:hypothetical protein